MRAVLILLVLISLFGCAVSPSVRKELAAGKIGCTPNEITVSHYSEDNPYYSWVAECHGKKYVCSKTRGNSESLSCKEENN